MYTLRRIAGDGVQMNIALGKTYNLIEKDKSLSEFNRCYQHLFKMKEDEALVTSVYAFVSDEDGKNIYPLFKTQKAYIMTESGKTFSNISFV